MLCLSIHPEMTSVVDQLQAIPVSATCFVSRPHPLLRKQGLVTIEWFLGISSLDFSLMLASEIVLRHEIGYSHSKIKFADL